MSTFITVLDGGTGTGPRVAVKDLIDVAGVMTTAGCRAVALRAQPALADAECLRGMRAAGARIVGKTNLHELALLPFGTNPWYGTPKNPLDAARIPGGSSSGSAVAVATGAADIALGTDTGGSVRIPAACCGIAGLKTTHGRISTAGVWPLAPSLDTVGPMATTVAGLVAGMQLLEPGFNGAGAPARRIGRVRTEALDELEEATDAALAAAGLEVVPIELRRWKEGSDAFITIFFREFWESDHHLLGHREGLGEDVLGGLELAPVLGAAIEEARHQQAAWRDELLTVFTEVDALALPTLPCLPPTLEEVADDPGSWATELSRHTAVFNAAGVPGLALPIPSARRGLPGSLQLVGGHGAEAMLLGTAAAVEAALLQR